MSRPVDPLRVSNASDASAGFDASDASDASSALDGPSAPTGLDRQRMDEALALARAAVGTTEPNPRVGCVLGHADGRVIGRGATQQAGGPHAEVMALRDAAAAGHATRGCTAWVTLEPCAHHGRTPPCCDALLGAGVARVVVACVDPFPAVAGAGLARLRAAGVEVLLADADQAAAARALNIGFFSRIERGRPWVRLKAAASLDGRTALPNGVSQWITGPAARADGHAFRRRAGAVLTGVGTVLADDPRLDARLDGPPAQPLRVVLDPALRTPSTARLVQPPGRVRLYATSRADPGGAAARALQEAGAELCWCAEDGSGRVDLDALLRDLAGAGVNELHVEAGATLNAAWLASGRVDELLLYVAPSLLGPGRGIADAAPLQRLPQAGWHWIDCRTIGPDLRLRLCAGPHPQVP